MLETFLWVLLIVGLSIVVIMAILFGIFVYILVRLGAIKVIKAAWKEGWDKADKRNTNV